MMEGIMQNDFSLGTGAAAKIGQAAIMNQLPRNLKNWFNLLEEHVKTMEGSGSTVGQ